MKEDEKIAALEDEIEVLKRANRRLEQHIVAEGLAQGAIVAKILNTLEIKKILTFDESQKLLMNAMQLFVKPQATNMEMVAAGLVHSIIDRL